MNIGAKRKATKRQEEILGFIKGFILKKGFPPTRQEIQEHFGFSSPNSAQQHLMLLKVKGYIEVRPNLSRGIVVNGWSPTRNSWKAALG